MSNSFQAASSTEDGDDDPECEVSIPGAKKAVGLFASSELLNPVSLSTHTQFDFPLNCTSTRRRLSMKRLRKGLPILPTPIHDQVCRLVSCYGPSLMLV